ncbi:outer membrane lipoprotein-sorting protein [Congregibacter brevis]|uniref:Outer membrane lipoprotein-sorting protein n=1 Tax=Congregibacter brevis TaxID=3081201 RepID=A0ABZ0IHH5_9GAMM|nr:outer membrane lipoprotein-sorting protein [Congregibacter sp. IMCC45268]
MLASSRFFQFLIEHPKRCLLPLVLLLLASLFGLKDLAKDTRSDAFLAPDNPALLYRDVIREQFGLSDPMLIALVADGPNGVYRPDILQVIASLTDAVDELSNVDASNTLSLATESLITGTYSGIEVVPLLDPLPESQDQANEVRAQVEDFPLFLGTLVAEDGSAALIVVQLIDEVLAEQTYREMLALLAEFDLPEGVTAHVAGEGAIAGYLGTYIDADAQRLNPLAGLIIVLMIILAFRRLAPALLAVMMIIASVSVALGSMAALGIPFYVITNALPVILIGISVADTIHIFSHFYEAQSKAPQIPRSELIVSTMSAMWLPVTITSLTTAAGFLGLYFAAYMPPFKYFGLFAALGVAAAWLYSIVALPILMSVFRVQVAQQFIDRQRAGTRDGLAGVIQRLGTLTLKYPRTMIVGFAAVGALGAFAASKLVVDADRIRLFHPDEAIVVADQAINEHLNGTSTLDIVIETPDAEGIYDPDVLKRMQALQNYALTLPHVKGASSIVDYLKQMNRVLTSGQKDDYVLPQTRAEVAQYFLLYSFSADPDDFAQEVDYDYRSANVRITMNHGGYRQIKAVYESLDAYIAEYFDEGVKATMSGRVSLNYHWIRNIGDSHFRGLLIALLLVWLVAAASFRSLWAGGYTLLPVIAAVLIVYAFMVVRGLTLGVGTSMFAAVAIGLGVDFAIHTLSRLQTLHRVLTSLNESPGREAQKHEEMFVQFFVTTGRALLLNVLAVACGFGVLIFSQVTQLRDFGSIVMLSMSVAFLASVTLLPAIVYLARPAFIHRAAAATPLLLLVVALGFANPDSFAEEVLTADEIVARVNAVPQGEQVTRSLLFRTTDKRGRTRERQTQSYRQYFGEERRLVLFFTAPANIRDTAVLTWDYPNTTQDDQWLYLPALRKVRRIPAADRGDYFLGTDFSFEDMKLDGQLSAEDYDYEILPSDREDFYSVQALPKSEAVAKELGYSRTEAVINSSNWIVVQAEFWDVKGNALKTLTAEDVRQIDGIWTRHKVTMRNHQTGHSTELLFADVDYQTPIDERVFTQQALKRGL